jgi:HEAT repeat protein
LKRYLRNPWLWSALFVFLLFVGGALFLRHSVVNVMHPALDALSAKSIEQRWSAPEMLKIRDLGPKAIPPLRRVLREKDLPTTRFLLWVKGKWPGAAKYFHYFPDPAKLTERRWTACQVLQTLGPAGKSAAPELIKILQDKDQYTVNGANMALWAIGVDAEICEQLDAAFEQGPPLGGRLCIVNYLRAVKPPSERTIKTLTGALSDSSVHVQCGAAETLGILGVANPAAVSALKRLQTNSTDELVVINTSAALWELEKDKELTPVFRILEATLARPIVPSPGGEDSGQGGTPPDQCFLAASGLFVQMKLEGGEKEKALGLMSSWCDKSGRIFIRMLLLPPMLELGFPKDKCLEVCKTGLARNEIYYRIQAAQLLVLVDNKYPSNELDLNALIHDPEVGVRVFAAKAHWQQHRQANVVIPVLVEALNRSRHQSYYYDIQILPAALSFLGDIGNEAQAAVGDLNLLAQDPNPRVAQLAREALAKIRGAPNPTVVEPRGSNAVKMKPLAGQ